MQKYNHWENFRQFQLNKKMTLLRLQKRLLNFTNQKKNVSLTEKKLKNRNVGDFYKDNYTVPKNTKEETFTLEKRPFRSENRKKTKWGPSLNDFFPKQM